MTNNKQQTAIEWLVEEINKQKVWANPQQLEPLIDYALKKEKEQIKDAAKSCNYIGGATNIEAEQYYNETYGGNK